MKKSIYILAVFLIVIQFLPSDLPVVLSENPKDIMLNNEIPEDVQVIIKNSCYDCHSNETKYPWYAHVAPFSFLVIHDVKTGRAEINFSNWDNYKKTDKAKILDEISQYVTNGEMPMPIYTALHKDAALSDEEKEIIVAWADKFADSLFK